MNRPNLFLVGQPKAGTSALHAFLGEHPDIFMSRPKEPHFFCKDFHEEGDAFHGRMAKAFHEIRTLEEYLGLFRAAGNAPVRGEGSTHYLYSQVAAEAICEFSPDAKIVIMLREPISVLHSLHAEFLNSMSEVVPEFEAALELEGERARGRSLPPKVRCPSYLLYRRRIRYAEQVERFLSRFPRDQVKVLLHEDFQRDNERFYAGLLAFLNVDPSFRPNFRRVRGSRVPRSRLLNRLARGAALRYAIKKVLTTSAYDRLQRRAQSFLMTETSRRTLPPATREALMREFLPEVVRIGKLIDRDLVTEWGYGFAVDAVGERPRSPSLKTGLPRRSP